MPTHVTGLPAHHSSLDFIISHSTCESVLTWATWVPNFQGRFFDSTKCEHELIKEFNLVYIKLLENCLEIIRRWIRYRRRTRQILLEYSVLSSSLKEYAGSWAWILIGLDWLEAKNMTHVMFKLRYYHHATPSSTLEFAQNAMAGPSTSVDTPFAESNISKDSARLATGWGQVRDIACSVIPILSSLSGSRWTWLYFSACSKYLYQRYRWAHPHSQCKCYLRFRSRHHRASYITCENRKHHPPGRCSWWWLPPTWSGSVS